MVKSYLKKVLGNAKLSYEELESIETEGVLISRPLTYVYDELSEAPLTPSHLVIGRRLLEQSLTISSSMNTLARLLAHFRGRWKKEYLTGIRESQKLKGRESFKQEMSYSCMQTKHPRPQRRIGKVERLLRGRGNVVRATEVVTVDNSLRRIHMKRPIQKLYPLEVDTSA